MSVVVIVDPFSSGSALAPALAQAGVASVAVTSGEIAPFYAPSFVPGEFKAVLQAPDSSEKSAALVASQVTPYDVRAVVAGTESGVVLADAIAAQLKLPGNDPRTSHLRREKYSMQEAVRLAGLTAIPQILLHATDNVDLWQGGYPVVIKPLNSAGTDGVFYCSDRAEARSAAGMLLGRKNALLLKNDTVLMQRFIAGTEYVVDTVSVAGRHAVTAVWTYNKGPANGSAFVYRSIELLSERDPRVERLWPFALQLLRVLRVENGPAHMEIMMNNSGPVLIELGARMHGGRANQLSTICTGHSQIDRTVSAIVDRDDFAERVPAMYTRRSPGKLVFLISSRHGRFEGLGRQREIQELPSHRGIHPFVAIGSAVGPTVDLLTSPGLVMLAHQNAEQVLADECEIRRMEQEPNFLMLGSDAKVVASGGLGAG